MSDATPSAAQPSPARSKPLLQVERLSKYFPVEGSIFGKTRFARAVDGITLYVRHGETLAVVGESGCGKTTLGRTVLRLLEPTFGRIVLDGHDITPLSQRLLRPMRKQMQIIFQDPYASLNPRMTVGDAVSEGLRIHGLEQGGNRVSERAAEMLSKVGLGAEAMGRYPHELSAGQRQRVGIARALVIEPSFVVCDEPVSALDASIQAQVLNLLQDLQQERRVSYLFITHDLPVVRHIAHRVAVMYLGRVVEFGPTDAVFDRPLHPYTRALMSAAPVLDPQRRRLRILLEGELPDAMHPPSGCAFHPRCSRADGAACRDRAPSLGEVAEGTHHRVACWHPGE